MNLGFIYPHAVSLKRLMLQVRKYIVHILLKKKRKKVLNEVLKQ